MTNHLQSPRPICPEIANFLQRGYGSPEVIAAAYDSGEIRSLVPSPEGRQLGPSEAMRAPDEEKIARKHRFLHHPQPTKPRACEHLADCNPFRAVGFCVSRCEYNVYWYQKAFFVWTKILLPIEFC